MTNCTNTNKEYVMSALDIAKQSHDAAVLMPSGKRFFTKVANSRFGYQQLLDHCGIEPGAIKVAFEPTADYHRNITYWLAEAGCECFLAGAD